MADFNMSRLWLGKDGYYRDVNGNKIAQKGQPISGAAWRYLASKYGRDYANRTSMNTRNGNIFQNGRWRFNDVESSKQGRTATWDEAVSRIEQNAKAAGARKTATGYKQRNPFNNKDTYLNQDTKNKAVNATSQAKKRWEPQKKAPDSIGGKLVKSFGDMTGLYHINANASDLVGTAGYFIPGVGSAMSAGDAYNAARRGDWGEAAMDAVFAIPFIGNVGRGLKFGLQTAKFTKAANQVGRGVKALSRVEKPANWALNAHLLYQLPETGHEMYDTYQGVKTLKKQLQPTLDQISQAKQQGASEEDIKNSLGDRYNDIKILSSRDNSFTGNLGTMWDILSKE